MKNNVVELVLIALMILMSISIGVVISGCTVLINSEYSKNVTVENNDTLYVPIGIP